MLNKVTSEKNLISPPLPAPTTHTHTQNSKQKKTVHNPQSKYNLKVNLA